MLERSTLDREHLLAIMGPPEMFGELSVFDDAPRTAKATALTELRAVSVDREMLRGTPQAATHQQQTV